MKVTECTALMSVRIQSGKNPEQWAYIADWEENRADRAEAALREAADRAIAFVNNNYNAMGEWDDVAFDNLRAAIMGGNDGF